MSRKLPASFGHDVLAMFRHAADRRLPCPMNGEIARALGCSIVSAEAIVRRLKKAGTIRIEHGPGGNRRVIFPDGTQTAWTRRDRKSNHVTHVMRPQDIERPPVPADTRDLTSRLMGDPIVQREHEPWRPEYETAAVTLPRLSFLDGASA